MKLQDLTFERIEHYDPLNSRAKKNGTVSEWVARNDWGNAVAFGNTKAECLQDARRFPNTEKTISHSQSITIILSPFTWNVTCPNRIL